MCMFSLDFFASTTNKQMQDDRRPRYVDDRVITILPTKHEWRRALKAHESLHFFVCVGGVRFKRREEQDIFSG